MIFNILADPLDLFHAGEEADGNGDQKISHHLAEGKNKDRFVFPSESCIDKNAALVGRLTPFDLFLNIKDCAFNDPAFYLKDLA